MQMRGRDLFHIGRPFLRAATVSLRLLPASICEFILLLFKYCPTRVGIAVRYVFISRLAAACGDNVAVFEGVHLFRLDKMRLGDNISVHQMCYIDGSGGLTIGSDVAIAHASTIMTTSHTYRDSGDTIRDAAITTEPVAIGNDVWLGAGVRVLAGVTIGNRVVIGAGAVVTRDVPSNVLALGVPARVVRRI